MSDNIIISGYEQELIANEIVKSRYGKYYNDDIKFPHCTFENTYSLNYNSERVQNLLQMFLIYEKVILSDLEHGYDLSELVKANEIEYDTFRTSREKLGFKNLIPEIDYLFAQYIKSLVVQFIENMGVQFHDTKDLSTKECLLVIYDYFYPGFDKSMKEKNNVLFNKIIDENLQAFKIKNNNMISLMGIDSRECYIRYIIDVYFANTIEDLVWQLELSAKHDCPIIQSKYDFNNLQYMGNIDNYIHDEAYAILKIEYKNIIGELPFLESFDSAIAKKRLMKSKVKDLRDEIKNLDYILRNDGREKAIIKARDDIHKASKELIKNNAYKKIAKWTQFLAVPIGIAEAYYRVPPCIGLTVETVGLLMGQMADKKEEGNWTQLFRH